MMSSPEQRHHAWRDPDRRKPLSEQIYAAHLDWADKDAAHHVLEGCKNDVFAERKDEVMRLGMAKSIAAADQYVRATCPKWREYRTKEQAARLAKNYAHAYLERLKAMVHERISEASFQRLEMKMGA